MSDIQSALERARMVAAKITGQFSDPNSGKRPADSFDSNDGSSKKFASVNDAVGAQLAMLKAQQLGGSTCEEYQVPDKLVGLVIGRGGEQLHRLQADTQCKVQIAPDAGGAADRTFTLVGTKEAIERAKRSIDEILKRGSSLGSDPSNPAGAVLQRNNLEIVEVKVPGNKCGLIIGKGGETIKRLSEQYGVKLVVVQETSAASGSDKPLRITGEPEKVAAAKANILEMLDPTEAYQGSRDNRGGSGGGRGDYGDRKSHYGGGPNQSEAYIKVPGDKAGIVIGKGGESIKDINRRSGAHVEIDKSQRGANDGTDKMFIIKGDQEQIQYAQQLIYEKITGVQGSQPPQGYFNDPNQASPMHGVYGGAARSGGAGAYAGQQQQYMGYQQGGLQGGQQPGGQATDPNMSAAWAAYYQQYYGAAGQPQQQQAEVASSAQPTAAATQAASTTTSASTATATVNPATGQPDYSQAWVEYYRSLGMYEQADAILKQNAASSGTNATGTTNGSASSTTNSAQQAAVQSASSDKSSSNGYTTNGASSGGTSGYQQAQSQQAYGGGGYGGQQAQGAYGGSNGGYGSREQQRSGGH